MNNIVDTISRTKGIKGIADRTRLGRAGVDGSSEVGIAFKDALSSAIDTVNNLQSNADRMTQRLAAGEVEDLHEVMIAIEQVNIGLQLTMQIRNKVIEAYQEIMRMQV